jgi:hypothetical protein
MMPAEAAQLEMADFNDWFGNFNGESVGHEEGSADVLAEEFQPAEYVDVAPNGKRCCQRREISRPPDR